MIDKKECINVNEYSPLVLAYIGDAVYELFIRQMLVKNGNMPVKKLHKAATEYVNAKAQKEMILKIRDMLNKQEINIFKRGRNARSATIPKNSDIADYRYATGFEALIGYLYISGLSDRIKELVEAGIQLREI